MGCHMPKLDGFEATSRIRAEEEPTGERVPIVGLTSSTAPKEWKRGLAAGMDGFEVKPVSFELLKKVVERFLPCHTP